MHFHSPALRRAAVACALVSVALGAHAGAQVSTSCRSPIPQTADGCQKATDIFAYVAPQLGTALAGGNPTLGVGGSLGGPGHFSFGVRVNAVRASVPQLDETDLSATGRQDERIATTDEYVPFPTADAAVGLFRGLPIGLTHVGGVDVLASASYIREFDRSSVYVRTPDGGLKLGYGARLGILEENALVPGIGVTYLVRDLPTTTITGVTNRADTIAVRGLESKAKSWRVTASKSFLILGLAVGAGQDRYSTGGDVSVNVSSQTTAFCAIGCVATGRFEQTVTRTNYFADLTLNAAVFKLVGEIGQTSGGTIETGNTFGRGTADPLTYGSLGIRLAF